MPHSGPSAIPEHARGSAASPLRALVDALQVATGIFDGNTGEFGHDRHEAREALASAKRVEQPFLPGRRALEEQAHRAEPLHPCTDFAGTHGTVGKVHANRILRSLTLPECQDAMVGTLGQNACCDYRGGCASGLFCEETDYKDLGNCQPAGAALEQCWTRLCQPGLACVKQICTPYALLGEECVINNYVGGSAAPSNCGAGLYCDSSQQPPRCMNTVKTAGSACECFDCAADLYCDYMNKPSACKAYKVENEPCTRYDKCAAGLECMAGTCRRIASLSMGEQCHGDPRECAEGIEGASCLDDGTGITRCSVPGLKGAPCDPEVESAKTCAFYYDLICDEASRSCQPLPGLGESCQDYCADYSNVHCLRARLWPGAARAAVFAARDE